MPRPVIIPLLSQSFEYNFAQDGGAIGSLNSRITIPNLANICLITGKVITGVTDGGAGATINIGWLGNLAALMTTNVFPIGPGSLGLTFSQNGAISVGLPILFSIAGFPLTGGRMILNIGYYNLYQ